MGSGLLDLLWTHWEPIRGKFKHVSDRWWGCPHQEPSDHRTADFDEDTSELKMAPVRTADRSRPPGSWAHV